nr:glycosyltransferase family 10 [Alteromonas macleodii]
MDVLFIGSKFHGLDSVIASSTINSFFCSEEEFLNTQASSLKKYDVIVVLRLNILLNAAKINIFSKVFSDSAPTARIIFWTHETFWDRTLESERVLFGRNVRFMNCYTDDVFLSPFSFYFGVGGYLWSDSRLTKLEMPDKGVLKKRFESADGASKVCAYNTCFHGTYHKIGDSLLKLRNDFIKYMYDHSACTVYGKNWTGQWSLDVTSESRAGTDAQSWGRIKIEESRKRHSFSICIENTLLPNYATEKLAHAIESWLLPVYCFENKINQVMDVSGAIHISSSADLVEFEGIRKIIESMSFAEYFERLESLTESYNSIICQTDYVNDERMKPAKKLVERILGS